MISRKKYSIEKFCVGSGEWRTIRKFKTIKKANECLKRKRDKNNLIRLFDNEKKIFIY